MYVRSRNKTHRPSLNAGGLLDSVQIILSIFSTIYPSVKISLTMAADTGVAGPLLHPFLFIYQIVQLLIGRFLAPSPPKSDRELGRPKVAVIGAGITGVTAAAHCVGHGYDVVIFENGGSDRVGGIWTVRNQKCFYHRQSVN